MSPVSRNKPKINWLPLAVVCICLIAPISDVVLAAEIIIPQAQSRQNTAEQSTPEQSQTPQRLELLLEYYDRCLMSAYTDLPEAIRESYCACTSDKLDKFFTKDEIFTLAKGAGPNVEISKVLIEMEGPCLAYPLKEDIKNNCLSTARTHYFKTQAGFEGYCQCLGSEAYEYYSAFGRDIAALLMDSNKAPPDNLTFAIRKSRNYKIEFANWRLSCLTEYSERGKF